MIKFFLIGSRFYGTHREDSDYDYVGEDTPENRALCEKLGLTRIDSKHVRYASSSADVVLVNDLEKALYAREMMLKLPNLKEMSKDERCEKTLEFYRRGPHAKPKL